MFRTFSQGRKSIAFLLGCAFGLAAARAVDFSSVPGVVIKYQKSPTSLEKLLDQDVYLSSPSITIAPNGDYFASHDYFGNSSIEGQGKISIYRSTNKGQTWTETATITGSSSAPGAFQSTIFYFNNALYLWGPSKNGGNLVIRQSTNNGVTWTTPTTSTTGLLISGSFGGTSNTPVVYNNRLWFAQSGKRVASAPTSSNLLLSSSWTLSNLANTESGPFGSGLTITEAQVVASPQTGVLILPKIDERPNTVLLRVNPGNIADMINPTTADWVSFPGGDKKFGAQYDPVSQKFYVLNNPILPAYAWANPGDTSLTRNTAAILSSKDLYNWNVERIFLFSANVDHEGYQYFNFAFEGEDLAVVSRTAKVLAGESTQPPRGHDSNLITFHRITNFRTIRPVYQLSLDTANNNERRYERAELYATVNGNPQYQWAPLGSFQVGTSFAGAALSQPNGHVQASDGSVYIREAGGRILRFDPLGNFLETVAALPSGLSFTTSDIYITPPALGESGWIKTGAGKWSDPLNWFYWGRADTNSEVAYFGSAISANVDITVDGNFTVKGIVFRDDNRYWLDQGSLTLEADTGSSFIKIEQGNHRIFTAIRLNTDTDVILDDHLLQFYGNVDLRGKKLSVYGDTRFETESSFVMNSGRLVLDGRTPLTFVTSNANLNGTLQFTPYAGASLALGASYTLINWTTAPGGPFQAVVLPTLATGLKWDTSALYTTGVVKVVTDPAAQPPGAPMGLSAVWSGTQVNLSWNAVSGATSYKVSRGTASGGPYTQIASNVTATSYADSGPSTGTYYYVVSAVNAFGTGAQSNQASVNVPPGTPGSLSATPVGTSVSLSWAAVSGATSYKIERGIVSGGPYSQIASGVAVTNYADSGLSPGTYFYVVSAVNAQGTGARSNQASASIAPPLPAAPTNLTAQAGDAKVTLSWNAVSGATSYTIKVGLNNGGPYVTLAGGVTATSYADNNLSNGTTYYYVVAAVNANGTGPDSSQASATPRKPPQLTGAVIRKAHGSGGNFDIPTNEVECRQGNSLQLVISFDKAVASGQAAIGSGTASVSGAPQFSGTTMTVGLNGVADAQNLRVDLANVQGSDGSTLASGNISLRILSGDANGDGNVNAADMVAIRNNSGANLSNSNKRCDVNLDGNINAADMISARNRSGTSIP